MIDTSASEFEPRVNGGAITRGGYSGYTVIVVGVLESQVQQGEFRFKTSDDVSILIRVPYQLLSILSMQGSSREVFEIIGEVQQDFSISVSKIVPLFDNTPDGKEFDLKLYDKLVSYWSNPAFSHLFFPPRNDE